MKNFKKNSGITLIALIITIIILLILVAVTISVLINSRLTEKAKSGAIDTRTAYTEESRLGDSVNIDGVMYTIDELIGDEEGEDKGNVFKNITKKGDTVGIVWQGDNFIEGLVQGTSYLKADNALSENTWEIPFICIKYDSETKEAVLLSEYVLASSIFFDATTAERSSGIRASDGQTINTYEGSVIEGWINSTFKNGLRGKDKEKIKRYGLIDSTLVNPSEQTLAYKYKTTGKAGFWTTIKATGAGAKFDIQTLDSNYPAYTYWPVIVWRWTTGVRPIIVVDCNE